MKRLLIILSLLGICNALAAKEVEKETAQYIAQQIFKPTKSSPLELALDDGAIYVYNNPAGGFVIISADDAAYPILGYSDTGSFSVEGLPKNISNWLCGYKAQINFLRKNKLPQTQDVARMWQEVGTKGSSTVIKELRTPIWDQKAPFSDECPDQAYTGCVATAVAEIMYWHKWPESQSGTLPSYSYKGSDGKIKTVPERTLAASYAWDKMLYTYSGVYSTSSGAAVASLCADVSVMLQSEFSSEGTGALSEDIIPCMVHYYGYDSSAVLIRRDEMPYSEWAGMLKAEIDADRPVCYSGYGDESGHQFVLDGYGTADYFHFNFGWSGRNNGMYRLEAISTSEWNFSTGCTAIINLKPDEGGSPVERVNYYASGDGSGGLRYLGGTMAKGGTVKFSVSNVCFNNSGSISGLSLGSIYADYAMTLFSMDGTIKEVYESSGYEELPSGYAFSDSVSCTITKDLSLGDYFMYCYKTTGGWTPVELDYTSYNLIYNGSKYAIWDKVAAFDYPSIVLPESCNDGSILDLRLENCQRVPFIVWYYDGVELANGVNSVRLTSGRHTILAEVTFFSGSCLSAVAETQTLEAVVIVQ